MRSLRGRFPFTPREGATFPSRPLYGRTQAKRLWGAVGRGIIQRGGVLAAATVAVAVLSALTLGLARADDLRAATREPTHISPEALAPALTQLASERGFQVVFRSEIVGNARTHGAEGELTIPEALTQLLAGTGLTFHYLDSRTITIAKSGNRAVSGSTPSVRTLPTRTVRPESNGESSDATQASLGPVTIEATKGRQALQLEVDHFATAVVYQPPNDGLYRWDRRVCPLVAGFSKTGGEFILERISKAAVDAHAPLAGRVCHPNLYVVATDSPERLLKSWWARDREMYNANLIGVETVNHFIRSRLPVRVWYNTVRTCRGGFGDSGTFVGPLLISAGCAPDTRLVRFGASNISSAIVVIDLRQIKGTSIQQVADYIALTGLADVRLVSDPIPLPSILELFEPGTAPKELTLWDRALLYSLYNTSPWQQLQMPELELSMVRYIAR